MQIEHQKRKQEVRRYFRPRKTPCSMDAIALQNLLKYIELALTSSKSRHCEGI